MELIVNATQSKLTKKWNVQILEGRRNVENRVMWNGVSESVQNEVSLRIAEYFSMYDAMQTAKGKEANEAYWQLTLKKNEVADFIVSKLG